MNGVIFALLSSLFWGFNGVLLRKGFEDTDVISGTFTVVCIMYLVISFFALPQLYTVKFTLPKVLMLAAAGIISYTIGRLFTYSSVASIGSSRAFSGTSTRILFSAIFGVILLGERMCTEVAFGTLLMIVGLYIFSTENVSLRGLVFSILGGFAYGLAALLIKVGMLKSPLVSTFVAATFGFIVLTIFVQFMRGLKLERNKFLLTSGTSLALGNISYYLALSTAPLIVVVPLSNLYPLVATSLSYFLIQKLEKVKFRTFIGSVLAVVGSIIIAVYS